MRFMQIAEDGEDGVRASLLGLYIDMLLHTTSPSTATPDKVAMQPAGLPHY